MERKLATIRIVDGIAPIEGADLIELAFIGGWQCITKKGEFKVGDYGVYFEIDSFLPASDERYKFLEPRFVKWNNLVGARIKTIKLKGQLAQGLLLPLSSYPEVQNMMGFLDPTALDGHDVTELLGVQKWEKAMPAELAGRAKGNFPMFIPKTDQERVQNLTRQLGKYDGEEFQATIKLDGSSMTLYQVDSNSRYFKYAMPKTPEGADEAPTPLYVQGVCSRNIDLVETEGNQFWKTAREQDLLTKLSNASLEMKTSLAMQGELVGFGIQDNYEKMKPDEFKFFCFSMFDIEEQKFLSPVETIYICEKYDIAHVPELGSVHINVGGTSKEICDLYSIDEILKYADGPGMNSGVKREGVVFKHMHSAFSFKAISNSYLLKTGN